MTSGNARYSDGRFLGSIPVSFTITNDHRLHIQGENVSIETDAASVRTSERIASVPTFVYLPDGGILETHDHEACEALAVGNRWAPLARLVHGLEGYSAIAAVATVLVVAFVGAALYLGLPGVARHVAIRVPESVDQQAGRAALAAIDAHIAPSSLTFREQQHVRRQLARLYPEDGFSALPTIEFRFMGNDVANAFALPGNVIIVTDPLVKLATDDELAAILAHEVGHLENRHALQSALRRSFALLFVTAATGDLSALTSVAATVPFLILNNGYSRDLEREADEHAHALLEQHGIDTRNFSSLLMKIEKAQPVDNRFAYLSTHPSTDERIQRFGAPVPASIEENPASATDDGEAGSVADLIAVSSGAKFSTEGKDDEVLELTTHPDVFPKPIRQVRPRYPRELRRRGMTGDVLIGFVVDRNGRVRQPDVVKSAHPGFNEAALAAVKHWQFLPAMKDGAAVNFRMNVPIIFSIQDDPPEPALRAEDFIPSRERGVSP